MMQQACARGRCATAGKSHIRSAFVACAISVLGAPALAQDAKINTSFEPDGAALFVGQKGTLIVELLAPGYFAGSPAFDLPNVPGMVIVPPVGSPVIDSRTAEDVSYTVQRHELSVFSHREGEQTVPPFHVRFAFKRAPLDKVAVSADLLTDAVQIQAKSPPGAQGLANLICANQLTVDERWSPKPGPAKAGDSFTRTITFTAEDIPGMAFPPFPSSAPQGVRTYQKQPEVLDRVERGKITGIRREEITYACQTPGRYEIPAARFTWWDLDDEQLKAVDFPSQVFVVAANPALASAAGGATAGHNSPQPTRVWLPTRWTVFLALLASIAFFGVLLIANRRHWLQRIIGYLKPVKLAPLNPWDDRR